MRKREIVSFSIVKLNAFTSLKIFETRSKIALKPIEIGQKPWKHSKRKKAEKLKSNYAFNFLFNNSFPISLDRRKFHERSLSAFDKTGREGKNEASSYLISSKRTKFIFESKLLFALKKRNYISALNSNFFPRAGPVLRIFFFLCSSFTSSRATNALASSNRSKVV